MTVGVSTTNVANGWLNAIRTGGTSYTAPTTVYVQLHTADPGASGTTSVSVGSTTRNSVSHNAASSGSITISGTAGPWTNGGTSETITHVSVWTATTAGTFLYSAALSSSQAWASGNTFTLNGLTVSISPLAA